MGVAGLGRAFMLMLPALAHHPGVKLVACCDKRPEARAHFTASFGGRAHESFAALVEDPAVEAIYLATPHDCHAAQAIRAAEAGRHLLVEKPMALTLAEAAAMRDAAARAGIALVVGHSHAHDGPIRHARRLIASGAFGPLRMITGLTCTDFLERPRRPEEFDPAQGGGVVFSQGTHQIDILRTLGGGRLASVRAAIPPPDPARPMEGAYNAFFTFADGASATLTYAGHGRFDSDALVGWIDELGRRKDPAAYGTARAARLAAGDEAAAKRARSFGPGATLPPAGPPDFHNQFGFWLASCAGADLLPDADGVAIHGATRRFEPTPRPAVPRGEVLDEWLAAIRDDVPPRHDAAWGLATLEAVLALRRSAALGREIRLHHQMMSTG